MPPHDRYARLSGILPVERMRDAFAVVGGVGALGNEVAKNLALLGVGRILLCDHDTVEIHNLTRSVLFRQEDTGRAKAEVAAERLREINPDVRAIPFVDSIGELGLGVFRRADMIFTTFDRLFPRYLVNEACLRLGKTWIDGGMSPSEHTRGGVCVYDGADPEAFCYSCGTSPEHVAERLARHGGFAGCQAREKALDVRGGVPTTPMMASMIGGLQTAAATDLMLRGQGGGDACAWPFGAWELDIRELKARRLVKRRREPCYHHDMIGLERIGDRIVTCPDWTSGRTTAGEVLARAGEDMGTRRVSVQLPEIVVTGGSCDRCGERWDLNMLISTYRLRRDGLRCPRCGEGRFETDVAEAMMGEIEAGSPLGERPLADCGLRRLDIVKVASYDELGSVVDTRHYELTGDADLPPWA